MSTEPGPIARWSAAIREIEVLEPWLTESHWDEHYWDDVAARVVELTAGSSDLVKGRAALATALQEAFPDIAFEADRGLYRDNLELRLTMIVQRALAGPHESPADDR